MSQQATPWTDLPPLPLPSSLRPTMPTATQVHLWLIPLDVPAPILQACHQVLAPDELQRAERFCFPHLRDRFTAARAALRHILASYLDTPATLLRFTYGPQGKPGLGEDTPLTFNLAHSHNLAVLAIANDHRVGVDLERCERKPDLAHIANRHFTRTEADNLAALPDDQHADAFYACWTLKEAYLKATGDGLSTPLDSFEVHFPPTHIAALASVASSPAEHLNWQASSLTLDHHAAALLVEGHAHTIHRALWNPPSPTREQP